MSTNKKFRIQNGVDVKGELTVNDVVIIRADGTIVAGAIADAVSSLVDEGALTGSGSSIVDSDSQIFIDVNSNTVAIASETATRISDIASLQTQIDSLGVDVDSLEVDVDSLGVNADTQSEIDSLQAQIDAILGTSPETLDTLVEIVSAFEGADSDIQTLLAANSSSLSANTDAINANTLAINAETSLRQDADDLLQQNIDAEVVRATAAEQANAAAIAAEAVARADEITSLQSASFTYNDSDGWSGDLVPSTDNEYALGSPDRVWKDLYIGPGSLYINGTKILEDNSGTITMYADAGQNLSFGATGGGNIDLNAGEESVQLKSDLVMSVGETISTVGGEPTKFGGAVDMGTHKVKNVGVPIAETDAATKKYVDDVNAQGTISGDKVFEDNVKIEGNLTVEGTTTTLDSQTLRVADNIVDLNSNVSTGAPVLNAGIRIMRGDEPAVQLRWNELDDRWEVYDGVTATPIAVESSDVITEGSNNLFFTVVRAREAVSQDIADAVAAEASLRGAAIDAEIARATSAEQANAAAIVAEASARADADSDESAARIAGDATVQAAVDAEEASRIAGDLSEAQARAAAISDLQSQLNSVTGTDLSALQSQLDAIVGTSPETLDTIQEVVAAFEGADSDLTGLITGNSSTITAINASLTQEVSDRTFAVLAEKQQRENADDALQASIDAVSATVESNNTAKSSAISTETAARIAGDSDEAALRIAGDAVESTARIAGDATLQAAVDAEAARAIAVETANASAISAEETRALAAETDLQNQIDQVQSTGATHPLFSTMSDLPDASANHGMFAHVHAEGSAFFAHGGQWVKLANMTDLASVDLSGIQSQIDAILGSSPETLDTLQEIVAAFESADGDLQTLMTANSSSISDLDAFVGDGAVVNLIEPSNWVGYEDAFLSATETTLEFNGTSQPNGNGVGPYKAIQTGITLPANSTITVSMNVSSENLNSTLEHGLSFLLVKDGLSPNTIHNHVLWDDSTNSEIAFTSSSTTSPYDLFGAATIAGPVPNMPYVNGGNYSLSFYNQNEQIVDLYVNKSVDDAAHGGHNWVITDLFVGDASSTLSLDTSASTVVGAINELHAEMADNSAVTASIQAETDARIAADTAEQTARQTADTANANAIINETNIRSAADAAETSARISADNALDAKIDAETASRQAEDTLLSSQISTESSRLDIEISNRTNVDAGLQTQIDTIVADNAARTASGATIAEVNAVQSSLDAEVVRAQLAEQANASAIVTGDAALQAQLDAIVGTSPETLDTLQEIVTAYSNADGTLQGLIDANSGALQQLQTTIGADNVPLITPDIGETITYEVEYAGRQFYAISDSDNIHIYDSVDPSTPVATLYRSSHSVRYMDCNSQSLFVNWSDSTALVRRYEWSDLVLGITSTDTTYYPANGASLSGLAVSEEYIYAYETSSTDELWKQPISSSGYTSVVSVVYNETGIGGQKIRVFGDKLLAFDYDGADSLRVWDLRSSDGWPVNLSVLTSSDQNSDVIHWARGEDYGAFESSSTLIAVGAPLDDTQGEDQGSVYLFNPDNLTEAHTKLYAPAEYAIDHFQFGHSIALTDTRLIVGARDIYRNNPNISGSSGYIFIYDATNLSLPPLVVEPPTTGMSSFPWSMHEESNRLLVRGQNDVGLYVYDLTNMDQPPVHLVEPTWNTASGHFGNRMAISPAATVTQSITDTIIPAQGLGNSINYLESQRQKLRTDLEANLAAIQSNDADIASIAADVATNTANIATNAAAIVAVDADRTAFEASVNADRQAHRDAVQADIDQVNADRTAFENATNAGRQGFEDAVNASQAQFIADHDSDYNYFTSSVSGSFADTNLLQNEIRGRMGTGHIALPQETTSISYNKDVGEQYYTVIEGDNEFFVYTSAEYVENQSVQTGLGTRVVLPSAYNSKPEGNFITRDHVIVMARLSGTATSAREIYFLVYELATIDSSSLPIAEVHADLHSVYDHAHIRYDGGSKVLIGNVSTDTVVGSVRIYDVPSLVVGNAIYIETTSEDLPAGVNYPTLGSSDYDGFACRVDWNDTHVFVGAYSGQDRIFVYDRTDLSYVTTLQDSIHGGGNIAERFVVSNTMIVAIQRHGSYWLHQNEGRLMVWDASNLNAAPVYRTDNSMLQSATYQRYGDSYYMYHGERKLAVSDNWLVFGNTYEIAMVTKDDIFNNNFPSSGVNSNVIGSFNYVEAQFKGVEYAGYNFANVHVYQFGPNAWGGITSRDPWDYPYSIQIQNDKLIITSRSMRMSGGTSENTGTIFIHDLNNFTDLVNGVEGVSLQHPVMIEENGFGSGHKLPAVSATGTVTLSVTETFNPNDDLTTAVNYLNAKKEELLTAVEAVTGSSTIVQDLQTIESNIDFKLLAQDARFDSDKTEQEAIYAAANAEQASIYDSANAAHVAYFEQYTSGETAARESADTNLQTQITSNDNEIASLQSQVSTIVGTSPSTLDTLQEIVTYFDNADDNLAAIITSNENKVNAVQGSLSGIIGPDTQVLFQDTQPADGNEDDIWYDTSTGKVYKGDFVNQTLGFAELQSTVTVPDGYDIGVVDGRTFNDQWINWNTTPPSAHYRGQHRVLNTSFTLREPMLVTYIPAGGSFSLHVNYVYFSDGSSLSRGNDAGAWSRPSGETRLVTGWSWYANSYWQGNYTTVNGNLQGSVFQWVEVSYELESHTLLAHHGDDQVRDELTLYADNADNNLQTQITEVKNYVDLTTGLNTTDQTVVGSINELKSELDPISNPSLTTAATDVVGAINELNTSIQSITGSDTQFLDDIATNQTDIATLQSDLVTTNDTAAVIRSDLTTESSARQSNDANLQTQIDTLTSTQTSNKSAIEVSLANEVARATVAENTLQANIDAEELRALTAESVNAAAVVTEKTRAQAIEAGLAADIAVETARASAAEVQLANHIGANFTNGSITVGGLATFTGGLYFGDGTGTIGFSPTGNSLQVLSDLDLMGNRLINYNNPVDSGDIANKYYVDTTTQAVSDRIDAVLSGSGALDTIVEVVAAFENADSDIQALITSNSTSVTANTDAITAEVASRQQAILDEATARANADSDLSASVSNEITRATAAEGVLTSQLSDEIARATSAETSLEIDLSNETLRATAAEGVNAQAIADETTRATTVEASLAQDIADESLRAQGAEAVLTSDVSTNATAISNLQSQVAGVSASSGSSNIEMTAEVNMSSNKITDMADPTAAQDAATKSYVDATVATEATSRTTEDTSLQSNIDAANARIDAILNGSVESLDTVVEVVSAFEGADSDIQNLITANASTISQNATAIATEATARANADSDEAALRTAADAVLTADLAAEVARATDAESAEAVARANADSDEAALRVAGDATVQAAVEVVSGRVDAILNGSSESLDTIVEVVAAFENADSDIQTLITSNSVSVSANADAIVVESTRATDAESVLQSNIDTETSARTAGDASLQSQIDTLSATQSSDKSLVDGDVAAETARATAAESALQSAIDAEELARTSADSDEAVLRTAADAVLQSAIDAEELARTSADSDEAALRVAGDAVLTADLATEVARATAAESAETSARVAADSDLQTQIDFIKENTDPAALDSLTELVSAFQDADSDVTTMVASNASAIAATNARTAGISVDSDSNVALSVGIEMGQNNIKDVNDVYANRAFIDTIESNDLKVQTGTVDFEGSIVNFGSSTIIGGGFGNATKAEIDQHLNVSAADSGEFLKWNGTDYEFTDYIQGRIASNQIVVEGSLSVEAPGSTLDWQDGLVHFGGSNVIVDEPTDLSQAANKRYVDEADSDLNALLSTAISNEESRATTAEGVLTTNLANEATVRANADSDLQSAITAEETVRISADATLTTDLANEISRAQSAESALDVRMTTEEGNVDTLQSDLASEISRATSAEGVLTTNLANEISRATSAEATLASDISAEESRALAAEAAEASTRADADSDLQSAIDAEVARATAAEAVNAQAVVDEGTARTTADNTLQSNIDTVSGRVDAILNGSSESLDTIVEVVAAFENADSDLQTLISSNAGSHTANAAAITAEETRALTAEGVLQSAIDAEETRATGVETDLQSQITSEVAARSAADQSMREDLDSDIAAEAALRVAGDASLQSGLDVEVARATAAEGVLQSLLDSEQSARILSDQGLQSAITAEENARIAADAVLQSAIDAEELARTSADNALQANINAVDAAVTAITNGSPETLNQLVEVVAAFEDADSDLQTVISNLGGDASALTARVSTLESEMDATELATTSNANAISAETVARVAAVQVNADAITAESTARAAAITAEQNARAAAIVASESDRDSADAELQSQIDALSAEETAGKSSLQFQLGQEEDARIAGDSDLTDSLAAEVARATAAESALSSDISAEESARVSADASLQSQIDFIVSNTDSASLDSLTEIVAEFQSVDGTLSGLISSNGSRITSLETNVGTINSWTTDNLSEGSINKYWTEQRTKDCLSGGLCIDYNSTTGEISIDEVEAASSLTVAESHDANALGGQAPTYYRINVYDAAGNLVN